MLPGSAHYPSFNENYELDQIKHLKTATFPPCFGSRSPNTIFRLNHLTAEMRRRIDAKLV